MKRHAALGIDFAALRTLTLVYRHRSFTGAAAVLEVNQSAVSYTIDKLRKAFDDPLFFRQAGKVVPTERCATIVDSAAGMLEALERLTAPAAFDPATAEQTVTLACNYYERQIILPEVLRALRAAAPGLRIETINATSEGDRQLQEAQADLLMGPLRPDAAGFYRRTLLEEHYVCVMDPANPLTAAPLTLDLYVRCPHVTVTYGGNWRSRYLVELDRMGLSLSPAVTVPSPAGLEQMIAGTDLVATVPSRVAERFGPGIRAVPSPCPAPFEIDLVWTTRTHHAPMQAWLRDLITSRLRARIPRTRPEPHMPDAPG